MPAILLEIYALALVYPCGMEAAGCFAILWLLTGTSSLATSLTSIGLALFSRKAASARSLARYSLPAALIASLSMFHGTLLTEMDRRTTHAFFGNKGSLSESLIVTAITSTLILIALAARRIIRRRFRPVPPPLQ